eukprot:scaffold7500_cov127-Isochrysis_galbana.AAC.16
MTPLAAAPAEQSRSMTESSRDALREARGVTLMATDAALCHRDGWRRARRTSPKVPLPRMPSIV